MKNNCLIVLKSLLMEIPVSLKFNKEDNVSSKLIVIDDQLYMIGKKIKDNKETDCYLSLSNITLDNFIQMCNNLTDEETAIIAANIALTLNKSKLK